ncbi:hypothetical protein F0562_003429 [Nyssa sinensis]|uniref:Uncharacterized protein n=1 Tax=Nyssa sinensis TaxID=561372 RepID=A0A5J5BYI0_9ASTE|nr:hypothetical protein F0562_003429 [Nyssa sinensis]
MDVAVLWGSAVFAAPIENRGNGGAAAESVGLDWVGWMIEGSDLYKEGKYGSSLAQELNSEVLSANQFLLLEEFDRNGTGTGDLSGEFHGLRGSKSSSSSALTVGSEIAFVAVADNRRIGGW